MDLALTRRSVTFWMTLSKTGLDVELWLTPPDRVDFGDGWVTWTGENPDGGSSFAARWPVGRALSTFGVLPDDDRQCLRLACKYEGA